MPLALRAPAGTMSLLAYLLVHHGAPLARDGIAFALWPDLDERSARARLRWHLHNLLQSGLPAVDQPWVISDNRILQWNDEAPASVDLIAYDRFASNPADFEKAVALYTGELATGLPDEWLTQPRERYRQRQVEMLLALVARTRENGDPSTAASYAAQALQWDPWREDVVRTLMRLRHEYGDRAGAIQTYREFVERLRLDLGVDPMSETHAAYELIASPGPAPTAVGATGVGRTSATVGPIRPLPVPLSTFRGRDDQVQVIRSVLAQHRLVTLTGHGGVGKTRLALEAARGLSKTFPDGIALVELASLATDDMVVPWIARALGVLEVSDVPLIETLAMRIDDRTLLLVLDNCEQVLDGVLASVQTLLSFCPSLHVLATSREPLGIPGERVELVPPLAAHDGSSPAVQLFIDRALDAAPASRQCGDADDLALVANICERLDGLPLAIELAAARLRTLSLRQIIERLDDRFTLLRARNRVTPSRQQTMEAEIDWSYELLEADERRLFASLSVFPGTFSLASARAICAHEETESAVMERLSSLINKSILNLDSADGTTRYLLLDTKRAYAHDRLIEAGELEKLRRAHAEHFTALAEVLDAQSDGEKLVVFPEFQRELDNVRVALEWSLGERGDVLLGARLAAAAWWLFNATIPSRATEWSQLALALLPPGSAPKVEARLRSDPSDPLRR